MYLRTYIFTYVYTVHTYICTLLSDEALALTSTEKLVRCVLPHDTFVLGFSSCIIPSPDQPPLYWYIKTIRCTYEQHVQYHSIITLFLHTCKRMVQRETFKYSSQVFAWNTFHVAPCMAITLVVIPCMFVSCLVAPCSTHAFLYTSLNDKQLQKRLLCMESHCGQNSNFCIKYKL